MTAVAPARPTPVEEPIARPQPPRAVSAEARVVLLAALVVLLPMAVSERVWSAPGGAGDFNRRVSLAPFDLALAGLLVLGAWTTVRVRPAVLRRTPVALLVAGAIVTFAASFAVHPSPRGVELALRVLAGVAVVDAWRRTGQREQQVLRALVLGVGAVQSLLAVLQSARGEALGRQPIDFPGALYTFGTSSAGRGGLTHPYHLVVLLLLAVAAGLIGIRHTTRRRWWLVGLVACGEGIGVTYSRASLLALLLGGVIVLYAWLRHGDRLLPAALTMVGIGMLVAAVSFGDGWYARYESSTSTTADSGRIEQWRDAADLTAAHPLVGVGPGRYVIAVSELDEREGDVLPAHNAVLHVAAEVGVAGAVLFTVLGAVLVARVARRGAAALLPLAFLAPFFALDAFPYVFPTGLAITALAVAMATTVPRAPEAR